MAAGQLPRGRRVVLTRLGVASGQLPRGRRVVLTRLGVASGQLPRGRRVVLLLHDEELVAGVEDEAAAAEVLRGVVGRVVVLVLGQPALQ